MNLTLTKYGKFYDKYANIIGVDECIRFSNSLLLSDFEYFNQMLGCYICEQMEKKINFNELFKDYKKTFGEKITKENAECGIFAWVYCLVTTLQVEHHKTIESYFEDLSQKYGKKAERLHSKLDYISDNENFLMKKSY